jgi:UDP-N-acetylmuramoyl-tripeptide--D-alanyl-D-alanine ligase
MITVRDLMSIPHSAAVRIETLGRTSIPGVSTDTRTLEPRNIFFALRGDRFNGHDFIGTAIHRGASCAVVDGRWFRETDQSGHSLPLLVVDDTTVALGQIAHIHRKKFRIPVIAIAGSNGKTTTKDMVAGVLSTRYSVLKTEGNLNNQVGVPMTLLRMTRRHHVAVIEHGTNHPGELETLVQISEPTHAVITSIGREHLEFFSSLDGVAREEGTVFRHSRFGFINADEPKIVKQAGKLAHSMRYGFKGPRLHVRGKITGTDEKGCVRLHIWSQKYSIPFTISLNVPGTHNASNALTAAAVGIQFGITKKNIISALESFRASSKRMEILSVRMVTILNDTYNANPDSVLAALSTLSSITVPGKKIVVLGDMLELGDQSDHEHAKIGLEVADRGFEYLLTYGPHSQCIFEASKLGFAQHFDDKSALMKTLYATLSPGDAVLIKGSRGMKMEEVVHGVITYLNAQ